MTKALSEQQEAARQWFEQAAAEYRRLQSQMEVVQNAAQRAIEHKDHELGELKNRFDQANQYIVDLNGQLDGKERQIKDIKRSSDSRVQGAHHQHGRELEAKQ